MHLQSIILGVVQGVSEFLPISSSAHLALIPRFFSWQDPGLAYDVALHMGTLSAVLLFFWRDWIGLAKAAVMRGAKKEHQLSLSLLAMATIPAAAAGFLLEKHAEHTFRAPILIATTLAGFGLLLGYFDRRGSQSRGVESIALRDALIIGAAQALAIIPGVSRSGVTITAALALGLTRSAATRFSFLLSAPIIAGAGVMKSKHIWFALSAGGAQAASIVIGFTTSLIAGFLAIWMLSYMIKARSFSGFVAYRLALAALIVTLSVKNVIN